MKLIVDSIFHEFCHILKYQVSVYLIENLRDPDRGNRLCVYVDTKRRRIYIAYEQCEHERSKTLIHELSHILFCCIFEKKILRIEELLWKKFSRKQKSFLTKHIPKRISGVKVEA